jgi:DNA (cytosine-5)-methyltransferase 1
MNHLPAATFIDLYAGCGGLSFGLMKAGWHGLFAVERDALAFETIKHNLVDGAAGNQYIWPDWLPEEPISIGRFIQNYRNELKQLRGQVDLIAGGPPCQGFSLAGRRNKHDPRNRLFKQYIEIVQLVRPPFLLLENVRGITVEFDKKKNNKRKRRGRPTKPFSQKISDKLAAIGYAVYARLLKAGDFGVPQVRPRYIIFAVDKYLLSAPDTFKPFDKLEQCRKAFLADKGLPQKPISVSEAISDLESKDKKLIECTDSPGFSQIAYLKPLTAYQELLHGSLNGTAPNSLRLANHREKTVQRFATILESCRRGVQLSNRDRKRLGINKHCTVPLDPDKPSHTLTTLPDDVLHYSEPRILSVREYARLQSFPDSYEFKGKYTTGGERRVKECPRYTQVGNAVPPFLAECLGRLALVVGDELLVHIEDSTRIDCRNNGTKR